MKCRSYDLKTMFNINFYYDNNKKKTKIRICQIFLNHWKLSKNSIELTWPDALYSSTVCRNYEWNVETGILLFPFSVVTTW